MATRAKELSDLGNLKLDVTANGIDVVGVGSNFKSCLLYTSPSPRD